MERNTVALKRYQASPDSLRELVQLCDGFGGLRSDLHVLIKPNLVALDDRYPMSLYGIFTTTRLVHDMVILLKEYGVERITVGEGSVRGDEIEILTGKTMKPSGKASKTFLLGNCMIKKNRKDPAVGQAVLVKGCPPSLEEVQKGMQACGFEAKLDIYKMFRDSLIERYTGKKEFDETLFHFSG